MVMALPFLPQLLLLQLCQGLCVSHGTEEMGEVSIFSSSSLSVA